MHHFVLPLPRVLHFWMVVVVLGLGAGDARGQASSVIRLSPEDRERGLNGAQKNFYFTKKEDPTDDDYVNAGYFGQRLWPYLAGNQQALNDLSRYRRQKWLFLAERLTFVGAIAAYGAQTLSDNSDKPQYFSDPQKVTLGIAAVSLLSNIFITRYTNQHFQRAVEAHNADITAVHRGGLFQRLAPSGVGLAAAPAGQPQVVLRWELR